MKNQRLVLCSNWLAAVASLTIAGCGSSDEGNAGSGGRSAGTGGMASTFGGVSATSGGSMAAGGSTASGGSTPTAGGTTSNSGGTSAASGGLTASSGGATSGGASSESGGTTATGGAPAGGTESGGRAAGGMTAKGGNSGSSGGTPSNGGSNTAGGTGAAGASATCSATGSLKVGDNNQSITSGGESRTFIVHVPAGYTGNSPVPVILDFHPLGGTGSSQASSSGWKSKCDSVGCIAVFPDSSKSKASDNSWNAGYCCTNAQKNQVNDVQFARDIIKWLETNACVDAKRIYASGGSNGGGMTYRMACEAADVIAAVAPVDFRCVTGKDPLANAGGVAAANNTACTCTLPRPITVVAWDEKADTSIVPYAGGQTPNFATDCAPNTSCVGIGFTSAVVNFQTWANFDKCTGSATTDPSNSLCQTYSSCQNNTQVSLCSTTSGGHLAVYSNSAAKFTDTAWNILKTQSLP